MKILKSAVLVACFCSPAMADVVNDGYPGCLTEEALDEFMTALINDDTRQIEALNGKVCFPIAGLEFSMVDRGFLTSEIRVYAGGGSVRLFTPSEATR